MDLLIRVTVRTIGAVVALFLGYGAWVYASPVPMVFSVLLFLGSTGALARIFDAFGRE